MKHILSLVLVLASVSYSQAAWGWNVACPTTPIINNFNAQQYVGVWYEIERVNSYFEYDLDCVTATYGYINPTTVSVRNQGRNLATNRTSDINGTATIPNPSEPNKLIVAFPFKLGETTLWNNKGNYHVWKTDYTNYALVYSCQSYFFYKMETTWILGRGKSLPDATITDLKNLLAANKAGDQVFVKVKQTCNN